MISNVCAYDIAIACEKIYHQDRRKRHSNSIWRGWARAPLSQGTLQQYGKARPKYRLHGTRIHTSDVGTGLKNSKFSVRKPLETCSYTKQKLQQTAYSKLQSKVNVSPQLTSRLNFEAGGVGYVQNKQTSSSVYRRCTAVNPPQRFGKLTGCATLEKLGLVQESSDQM